MYVRGNFCIRPTVNEMTRSVKHFLYFSLEIMDFLECEFQKNMFGRQLKHFAETELVFILWPIRGVPRGLAKIGLWSLLTLFGGQIVIKLPRRNGSKYHKNGLYLFEILKNGLEYSS